MQTTLKCPHCGKYAIIKAGHALKSGVGEIQQYRCKKCGRTTTKPIEVPKDDKGRFTKTITEWPPAKLPNPPFVTSPSGAGQANTPNLPPTIAYNQGATL